MGALYPARTPKHIVDRVNMEMARILETPEVRAKLRDIAYTPGTGKPEELADRLQTDTATFRKLIQDARIKLD